MEKELQGITCENDLYEMSDEEYNAFNERQKRKGYDNHPIINPEGICVNYAVQTTNGSDMILRAFSEDV
jgi:uncharacterized protein (UPF0305 family)